VLFYSQNFFIHRNPFLKLQFPETIDQSKKISLNFITDDLQILWPSKFCFCRKKPLTSSINDKIAPAFPLTPQLGDQIGRIFAQWVNVYFGQLF
jgi:hypothetical protein